jgi:hypothetical protein
MHRLPTAVKTNLSGIGLDIGVAFVHNAYTPPMVVQLFE